MKKIKDFFKDYYKIIIPISLLLVLFIAFAVYYKISVLDSKTTDVVDDFYQYFYGTKYEYQGTVSTNRKGVIVRFKANKEVKFDATPIYYKNKSMVIFPKNMSVVMPTLGCSEYLTKKLSLLSYKKDVYTLTTYKYNGKLGRYFLYDGSDTYFFLDEVNIVIGDKSIKLSPMSYLIAKYNKYLLYYDKANDKFETINKVNDDIYVENTYYKIYIFKDQMDYLDSNVILTSKITELNTIDMKERR